MKVRVEVWANFNTLVDTFAEMVEQRRVPDPMGKRIALYDVDHADPTQRRVLGEQCRNAFEAGQLVMTYPVPQS